MELRNKYFIEQGAGRRRRRRILFAYSVVVAGLDGVQCAGLFWS